MNRPLLLKIGVSIGTSLLIAALLSTQIESDSDILRFDWFGRSIHILQPRWLYLAALLPYFFVVRTLSLTDVSDLQQYLSTVIRSALFLGCVLALAQPTRVLSDNKIATIVLVDVSNSVSNAQLEQSRSYAQQVLDAKKQNDEVHLISFAEHPHLIESGRISDIQRHQGKGIGTDIQSAIQLAYGIFPDGFLPRLLIISDGNETHGDLLTESYRAQEFEVPISYKTFDSVHPPEVRVDSLRLPDEIKEGAPFEIRAQIWSNHPDTVTLTLRQDDFANTLEPQKKVKVEPGVNQITFKSQAKRAGFTTYTLTLSQATKDTETKNNRAVMTAPIQGRPNILYVEGTTRSSTYFERALSSQNISVETRTPRGLPSSAKELERFDLVLISDVPAVFVGLAQMNALDRYVRDFGGGLIIAGGEDSFGSGGYQNTKIEKMMPVRFDNEKLREQPHIAIALVMDRSGSMSGQNLEAAKEAARATTEVLSSNDLITVIAFDQMPTTVVRLQRASNRTRISSDIARLSAGGGTDIRPALREAHEVLQSARAKVKHIILLSDGKAPVQDVREIAQDIRASRITISAIGIGGADRDLLRLVTDNGDGRLYMTDDLAALPRIFMKETTEAQKSALIEERVTVHINKHVAMIEGTGVANAPPLHGYVSVKPKPTAEVVLVSDLKEPILARWRLGTGTCVAWTSDIKNRWSVDWLRWPGYGKFWAQLIRTSMRRKVYDSYDMRTWVQDGRAHVIVDAIDNDDKFVNELETTLKIIDPKNSKVVNVLAMSQNAAGRYQADFSVQRYGSYMLKAVHKRNGDTVAESTGSVALPYPAEFTTSGVSTVNLDHATTITHGYPQVDPAQLFDPGDDHSDDTQDLWPWLLLWVACTIVAETYLKRLRIFGYKTLPYR